MNIFSHFKKYLKGHKGQSLIEILVVMAIFIIIISILINVLISTIKSQRIAIQTQNLTDNIRFAMEYIAKVIRASDVISASSGNQIIVNHREMGNIVFAFDAVNNAITQNGEAITFENIKVNDLHFEIDGVGSEFPPDPPQQPRVTIVVKAQGLLQVLEEQTELIFETTVSQRNVRGSFLRPVPSPPPIPGDVGRFNSLALRSDNVPLMSYYDAENQSLKFATCHPNPDCSVVASTELDSGAGNDVGKYSAIAYNSFTNDVFITYFDATDGDLKFIRCPDSDCSSFGPGSPKILDQAGYVGEHTDIALDSASFPRIAYRDVKDGAAKFIVCDSPDCSSIAAEKIIDFTSNAVGSYSNIELDNSDWPSFSYFNSPNRNLEFMRCADPLCNDFAFTGSHFIDTKGITGLFNSLGLLSDGKPVISYFNQDSKDLKFAFCGDENCNQTNIQKEVLDSNGTVGLYTSLAVDNLNRVHISYHDQTNGSLKYILCDSDCSSFLGGTPTTVDSGNGNIVGQFTSIAVGNDNLARIIYYDSTDGALKFIKCPDTNCGGVLPVTIDD